MALNIPAGKPVYTTRYADFKGVDYSTPDECVDASRFSDCDNLMFDKAGLIEKRYGFRCLDKLDGEIHSMKQVNIYGKSELLIHAGSKLYKFDGKTVTPIKKEGYKRYSYLITLPALAANHADYGYVKSRVLGFDFSQSPSGYKIKEMFMVKVSELPFYTEKFNQSHSETYGNHTPEYMKSELDKITYSQIEEHYRHARYYGVDAVYAKELSPEHYNNLINNGNFEEDREGLSKYGTGEYEIYANSMRVDKWSGSGCVCQRIPVKSIEKGNLYDKSVFYVTFLASEGWNGNMYFYEDTTWSKAQPNPATIRTTLLSPGLTGELTQYNTTGTDANIGNGKSSISVYKNKVWITTQNGVFVYDGIHLIDAEKFAYAPTTTALRDVSYTYAINDNGGVVGEITKDVPGNTLEAVNLLTRKRVNTFALSAFCGGYGLYNACPYTDITLDCDAKSVEKIEVLTESGKYEEVDKSFYDFPSANKVRIFRHIYAGYVCNQDFYSNVPNPYVLDGVTENLKVHFTATTPATYEKKIDKCYITTTFGIGKDDRLFATGNDKYPSYIWYSEFENFGYMPDINYIVCGDGGSKNLGFSKVNNNLLIYKEGNGPDTAVFMASGSLDSSGKAVFAVSQGISGVCAISEKGIANFDDMPLFLSGKGVYSIESTNIISEKTVVNRSGYINSKLIKENLREAALISYDDMVLCASGGTVYVLYPRKQSYFGKDTVYSAASFECLRWSIPDTQIAVLTIFEDSLFFGTKDGKLFKWNDDVSDLSKYNDTLTPGGTQRAVKCYFATKLDDDGSFMTLKTMIKRGCGVMIKPYAQSSVKISTLTEKEHETGIKEMKYEGTASMDFSEFWFSVVDFSTRDSGRIVPFNAKVKKYSTLCFKVENDALSQGFGVIGIEKRYTVGNYKKY